MTCAKRKWNTQVKQKICCWSNLFLVFPPWGGETPDGPCLALGLADWIARANSDWFPGQPTREQGMTFDDRSPIEKGARKKIFVQNNKAQSKWVCTVSCMIFLWTASPNGESFDWICSVMFHCRTVSSRNSNFEKKREDRNFYKRFVYFSVRAQSPPFCSRRKIFAMSVFLLVYLPFRPSSFPRFAKDSVSSNWTILVCSLLGQRMKYFG